MNLCINDDRHVAFHVNQTEEQKEVAKEKAKGGMASVRLNASEEEKVTAKGLDKERHVALRLNETEEEKELGKEKANGGMVS